MDKKRESAIQAIKLASEIIQEFANSCNIDQLIGKKIICEDLMFTKHLYKKAETRISKHISKSNTDSFIFAFIEPCRVREKSRNCYYEISLRIGVNMGIEGEYFSYAFETNPFIRADSNGVLENVDTDFLLETAEYWQSVNTTNNIRLLELMKQITVNRCGYESHNVLM